MAALQCEICGGKLVAKAGGLFECESCGMQYDKTRIQEMVQEIKGTVQVEGTVEVQGTVKVDNTDRIKSYLEMAEQAANGEAHEEAISYANKVLELDTKNVKALLIKASSLLWSSTLANQQFDAATELFAKALTNADDTVDTQDLYANILNELGNAYGALLNLQLGMAEHATDKDDATDCAGKMLNIKNSNIVALKKIRSAAANAGIETDLGSTSISELGMGRVSLAKFKQIVDKVTKEACEHVSIYKGSQKLSSTAFGYVTAVAGLGAIILAMQPEDKVTACDYMNDAKSRLVTAVKKAEFGPEPVYNMFSGISKIRSDASKELEEKNARKAAEEHRKQMEEHRKQLEEHPETFYANAKAAMEQATTEDAYEAAAKQFAEVSNYQDASAMIEECHQKAKECRKNVAYEEAVEKMTAAKTETEYTDAAARFDNLADWKDSEQKAEECRKGAEEARIAAENTKKKRKKVLSIVIPIACACIALAILLITVIIPSKKYNAAIALLDEGNTTAAYDSFVALAGYKDSAEKADEILSKHPNYKFRTTAVCEAASFGTYEQDNNISNGEEDIEWLVLAKEDNRALVISDKGLDCQQYNNSEADITWEKCRLRKWLNKTFIDAAFTTEEQAQIISAEVSADKNPDYNTDPGNATTDKIFLLSVNEVNKYISDDGTMNCIPTPYAIAHGAHTQSAHDDEDTTICFWWLRTPASTQNGVCKCIGDSPDTYGYYARNTDACVRPAMWINLES